MAMSLTIDRDAMISFLQALVRTPSVSTHEDRVAALVADEMRAVGYDEVRIDRMGNVIGRIGPGIGKSLLFDGHMDSVDVGDPQSWPRDPYAGDIHHGVLYGRGASDMKGALAAMVYAGKALIDRGVQLGGDLFVVGVVQEEPCEGLAIRHVIENEDVRPDWVVIGEATDLQISRGQRGRIEFRVTVHGRSCHASAPSRGINAIYGAARLVVGVELLALQMNDDAFLGKGSIAVTEISSVAGSRNAVPDACTLYIDRRLTTGDTEVKALAELRQTITREGIKATVAVSEYKGVSYTGLPVSARQYFPYWATAPNHPLVTVTSATIENTLGYIPRLSRWEFSTDGVYTAGVAGIPTIGFGPGEERYAHTVDEQIRLDDVDSSARVYADLATRLLGTR